MPLRACLRGSLQRLLLFYYFSCIKNETSMGPQGACIKLWFLGYISMCAVLVLCRYFAKDNLTWYTQDVLFLTKRLFPRIHLASMACIHSGTTKNSLGSALKDLPFILALTWRFVSRYPRGTD